MTGPNTNTQRAIEYTPGRQSIDAPEAGLEYWPGYLNTDAADRLFCGLFAPDAVAWEQTKIRIFGREQAIPRLNAVYGDTDQAYCYSGAQLETNAWTPVLAGIRDGIQQATGWRFSHVLLNLYRDGHDGMGWHSDDEPELGPEPRIASLSLGAERDFHLRHRSRRDLGTLKLRLGHGSLLLMDGPTQHHWQHALPKRLGKSAPGPRINLTFRRLLVSG